MVIDHWPLDRDINYTGKATLPVTEMFNATARDDTLGVDSQNHYEDPSMQASLLTAWSYWETPQQSYLDFDPIPANCSSQYCRWHNTTSLVIQHECQSALASRRRDGHGQSQQANITSGVDVIVNGTSVTIPTILRLNASRTIPDTSNFMTTYNKNRALIIHLAAIASHDEQRFDAAECIMYWAAEHNSETLYDSARDANLNETLKSVHDLPENRSSTEYDKDILLKAPCNANNGTDMCYFTITKDAHLGLQDLLTGFLTGHVSRNTRDNETIFKPSSLAVNLFGWSWKEKMGESSNPLNMTLDIYLGNTALGLSGYIRTAASTQLNGINEGNRLVYVIDWVYVIYPGVMLLLSLYLFVITMVLTRRMPAWKTSLLPFLYHGFDRPMSDLGYDLSSLPWMEEISKEKRVVLRDDGDGFGLRLREAARNTETD